MKRVSPMPVATLAMSATLIIAGAAAQEPKTVAFDVASVRPNRSGDVSMTIGPLMGDSFSVENAPLRDLIRNAYQLSDYELVDAPEWAARERFDIRAKARRDIAKTLNGEPAPERLMLRALLADRFKLSVHRETREVLIYALVIARSDRQLGPQLRATQTDCAALKKAAGGVPPRPADGSVLCGIRNTGTGLAIANALPMQSFARFLSGQVQRVVVDRTGLAGEWDSRLQWTPDRIRDAGAGLTDAPNLFTALQEQLGLKLESTKGPVEVMVVDHVERPTGD